VPEAPHEALAPLVAVVRAQQLAREVALARGLDPDAPPGLAKVTPTR
jgi:glucosamine--fructose-6-phosphate aminotransferase (isomerizing)